MNYIWEVAQKAEKQGVNPVNLRFTVPAGISPYQEIDNCPYESKLTILGTKEIGVNLYYRFGRIFSKLLELRKELSLNLKNDENLHLLREINMLIDILTQYLAEIDLVKGLNKEEVLKGIIINELKEGIYGTFVKDHINAFSEEEQYILAEMLIRLNKTGDSLRSYRDVAEKIFRNVILYKSREERKYILFINQEKTSVSVTKLDIINSLFWEFSYEIEAFWSEHFGVLGVEETLSIGDIAIY